MYISGFFLFWDTVYIHLVFDICHSIFTNIIVKYSRDWLGARLSVLVQALYIALGLSNENKTLFQDKNHQLLKLYKYLSSSLRQL